MNKILSEEDCAVFQREGFVCPIPILTADEVASYRGKLEAFEAQNGGSLDPGQRSKSFLLFKWLYDLAQDSRILDPIEQLIGPDILLWNTIFWIKEPGSKSFVSWHQDTRYWGLSSDQVVTAWLALSPAGIENGCMRVMPGTHLGAVLSHEDRYHDDNMLTRGQEINAGLDESLAKFMPLKPGEMSIHNYRLAHASGPNQGPDRRIGISFHYMPPDTRQIVGDTDCALLVRGEDSFHHFEAPPLLDRDMQPDALVFHKRMADATREVLYKGAEKQTAKL